jgi:hypothetical protein
MTNPVATLRNIAMLLPLRATEEARYYLKGIHIEPHPKGGALLIASNGHAMGIIYDETATVTETVTWMPIRALLVACNSYKLESGCDDMGAEYPPCAPVDGEMIELTYPTWGHPLDGDATFPDWRKPIGGVQIDTPLEQFNVEVANRFSKIAQFNGVSLHATPYRPPWDVQHKHTPLLIRSAQLPHFIGFMMPMRTPTVQYSHAFPDWLDVPQQEGEQV